MERRKLEIPLNEPVTIELLYDQPQIGKSSFGEYYLYSVRNGDEITSYSLFAAKEVHEQLKNFKKGSKVVIVKTVEQKANKIITRYDVKAVDTEANQKISPGDTVSPSTDNYFTAMMASYQDALRIQEILKMVDVDRCAITLFISRTKTNGIGI